jgi:NAD(P)-dependent dehydrogenase (short-subunit alcohol dehydrogenase family)
MEIQVAGQHAVVAGGTRGIGAAIVRALAGAGATIVSTARSQPAGQPPGVHFVESNISSAVGVTDLAERSLELLGGIDIVVSNASRQRARGEGALALTDEDYRSDLDTNLMAAVRLDRALVPSMTAQGSGAVVHIGSGATRMAARSPGLLGGQGRAHRLLEGVGHRAGTTRVRVNVVHPGMIRTDRARPAPGAAGCGDGNQPREPARRMVEQLGIPL